MNPKLFQNTYPITENHRVAEGYYKLTLQAKALAKTANPGQFIAIRVTEGTDPLLRRPFGIYQVAGDRVSCVYRVIGKGTDLLSKKSAGETCDVLGPLGQSAPLFQDKTPTAIIAGGVGIAAVRWITTILGKQCDLFYGVRTEKELVESPSLKSLVKQLIISTDDGSCGVHAMITEVFAKKAAQYPRIYCCGPRPMMKQIYNLCCDKNESYFFIEETMACGIGVCMGCVCETQTGYKRVCKEGPVFKGSEIKW